MDAAGEQRVEELQGHFTDKMGTIQDRMAETPARTVSELLDKLCLADALIEMFHADHDDLHPETVNIENRITLSAFADLERLVCET